MGVCVEVGVAVNEGMGVGICVEIGIGVAVGSGPVMVEGRVGEATTSAVASD